MAEATTAPGSAEVHNRLENADHLQGLTEADHGEGHAEPALFGLAGPAAIVGAAMLVFILILIWKKVPGAITAGLDRKIAAIREQLDDAKRLRAEAEALRDEYAARIAGAEKDAAAMLDHARREADAIVARTEADSDAIIARRERMAQDKIGAAERGAVEELRAKAATAAAAAAGRLIAARYDPATDKAMIDGTIDRL